MQLVDKLGETWLIKYLAYSPPVIIQLYSNINRACSDLKGVIDNVEAKGLKECLKAGSCNKR